MTRDDSLGTTLRTLRTYFLLLTASRNMEKKVGLVFLRVSRTATVTFSDIGSSLERRNEHRTRWILSLLRTTYGVRRTPYVCTYDSSESIQYVLKFASQPDFYYYVVHRSIILHTTYWLEENSSYFATPDGAG